MSATWKALRIVASIGALAAGAGDATRRSRWPATLCVDDVAGAAGGRDPLAGTGAERVSVDAQRLRELALGEDLHRHVLARGEAIGLHQLDRDLGAGLEAALQRRHVDWLRVRAE